MVENRDDPPLSFSGLQSKLESAMAGEPILQFFAFTHLPTHLMHRSMRFAELALHVAGTLPRNPERTVCLRKLLEAKDCAVRAEIYQ